MASAHGSSGRDDEVMSIPQVIVNLKDVQTSLQTLLDLSDYESSTGKYGYITREWGFSSPGGPGPRLGGKFQPWEAKLDAVASFFSARCRLQAF